MMRLQFGFGLLLAVSSSGPTQAEGALCSAATANAFSNCIKAANAGAYAEIDVTGPINCDDSVNLCQFTLTNIDRTFVVRGTTAQSGFYRGGEHGGYKHNTLTIQNSSGPVLLRDFTFDEGKNEPLTFEQFSANNPAVSVWTNRISPECTAHAPPAGKTYENPCPANSLRITASSVVTVDNVKFLEAKNFAIMIDSGSGNVTIRNSMFVDSFFNAIWSQNNGSIHGLHIENNKFLNIRSNALEISAVEPLSSDPVRTNTVTENLVENSHNTGLFFVRGCKGIANVCGGGEVLILSRSSNFLIEKNEIRNGGRPGTNIQKQNNDVRGIEMTPVDSHDIVVRNNRFADLSGPAIDISYNKQLRPLGYAFMAYQNVFNRVDSCNGGSPFNNEWFLNSEQNAKNNGIVPDKPCAYYPDPSGNQCTMLSARKPYDWDNKTQ